VSRRARRSVPCGPYTTEQHSTATSSSSRWRVWARSRSSSSSAAAAGQAGVAPRSAGPGGRTGRPVAGLQLTVGAQPQLRGMPADHQLEPAPGSSSANTAVTKSSWPAARVTDRSTARATSVRDRPGWARASRRPSRRRWPAGPLGVADPATAGWRRQRSPRLHRRLPAPRPKRTGNGTPAGPRPLRRGPHVAALWATRATARTGT
jgi:hypothetical protein